MHNYTNFIKDPYSPEINFKLGEQYHSEGSKAAALTYFLRAAEYGTSKELTYEALLKVALCLKEVENRPNSTRGAFLNAISYDPSRPEAYYHLSYDYQEQEQWQESYLAAIQGLSNVFNSKNTQTNIYYPGEHGLLFQKAVAGWWIGQCDESRELLQLLLKEYTLEDKFTDACHSNLSNIGGERFFKLPYLKETHSRLKYRFNNSDKIERNYSQAFQDMFVLTMLNGKENGTYLEIGAADPFSGNNTALLETEFNWRGISLDIDPKEVQKFNNERTSKCILQDATIVDFNALLEKQKFSNVIDYLQLDVEPAEITYEVLLKIPFEKYKFAVITYEHDEYMDRSLNYKELSRQYLKEQGYVLVVGDIAPDKNSNYEDWYVHPDLIKPEILNTMLNSAEGTKEASSYMTLK
tara:strand:+ start:3119 stop:4345 length:1227 start_codon:yes stop_codon:yes gene_type:complete